MRISRTWLLVLLVGAACAEDAKKAAAENKDADESVETAETRQVAEERADDRDKRQLPGQHPSQQQYIQRLPNIGGSPPQGFRSAPVRERDSEGYQVNSVTSTVSPVHLVRQSAQPLPVQVTYRATAAPSPSQQYLQSVSQGLPVYRALPTALPSPAPSAAPQRRPAPAQQVYSRPQPSRQQYADLQQVSEEASAEELEPEKEEPDRLTELLPHSKFSCQGRGTGYYADEGLACEVFHYCQDGARHSWICPEGFTFHQVHLICMPPSNENICQKSSSYFFVNDYLYRPINEEEVQRKPNVSLRYSDRYYPQNYQDDEEGVPHAVPQQSQHVPQRVQQRVPLQQGLHSLQSYQSLQQAQPQRRTASPAPAPASPVPAQYQSTARPSSSIQLQPSYRQSSQSNQVFHSPEEVNIPLQLRRPVATTARSFQPTVAASSEEYDDDEPVYRQG